MFHAARRLAPITFGIFFACTACGQSSDVTGADLALENNSDDALSENTTVPVPDVGDPQGNPSDFAAPADAAFALADYGDPLAQNKAGLWRILNHLGGARAEKRIIMAMAMQETNLMDLRERDASKDGSAAANVSILNVNMGMLGALGYSSADNGQQLNRPENLPVVAGYLLKALRQWGTARTLNFQRGGSTGFADGTSFGCAEYRRAIATIFGQLDGDLQLAARDGRRVQVAVPHV